MFQPNSRITIQDMSRAGVSTTVSHSVGSVPPLLTVPLGDFDAYIFDCDGTLVDSMPLHHQAWRESLQLAGAEFEFGWELFISRAGMGLSDTVSALNVQFRTQLDVMTVVDSQRRIFERLVPSVKPLQPVLDVASEARGRLKLGVCSGGERELVMAELRAVGIAEWFDAIVCRPDVARGKPAPDGFIECASRLGVAPQRCLVFEDGVMGIEAAQAAGMKVVLVDPSVLRESSRTAV